MLQKQRGHTAPVLLYHTHTQTHTNASLIFAKICIISTNPSVSQDYRYVRMQLCAIKSRCDIFIE